MIDRTKISSLDEMDAHAETALLAIPERWRAMLKNLAVVVEDWPEEDEDAAGAEEGDMLGMLDGPSLTEQSISDPYAFPTRLVLFRGVIAEEAADTGEPVSKIVRETVWHEVAHYFGHDEDGAYALETKWEAEWRRLHDNGEA